MLFCSVTKRIVTFITVFFLTLNVFALPIRVWNIAPTHWYIGFSNPELEIIVNAEEINTMQVSMKDYPGVEFIGQMPSANRDIAYLRVRIAPNARPGFLEFYSNTGGMLGRIRSQRSFKMRYQLMLRSKVQSPGVNTKDVMYLIFPDRFANGNTKNDNVNDLNYATVANRNELKGRHGGDIQGITNNLDYLQNLGVNALWLNPVQTNDQAAESFHGYAITNHYQIDPRLGSTENYLNLCSEMRNRNMKMVMDIIPNHFGSGHWMFKYFDTGWFNEWDTFTRTTYRAYSVHDPYASKLEKKKNLDGWFDKHMPDVNQRNTHMRTYLNQLYLWWAEYAGLSAYRIDTYTYPDQEYMNELNKLLEKEFPNLFIFGETWVNGSATQSYFVKNNIKGCEGNTLASVTDFQMCWAITEAVQKPMDWTQGLNRIYHTLSEDFLYQHPELLVTFLDNHDMSRIWDNCEKDFDKWKMANSLLLTLRGIPCIYYGTEILMDGNTSISDAYVRRDFLGGWASDSINLFKAANRKGLTKEAFEYLKTLIALRRNNEALQSGKTINFAGQNSVFAFKRVSEKQEFFIVSNSSASAQSVFLNRYFEGKQIIALVNCFNQQEQSFMVGEETCSIQVEPHTTLIFEVK